MKPDPAKFRGFPHIFWINRTVDAARRSAMEHGLAEWELPNTRIEAFDGDGPLNFIEGAAPNGVPARRLACYASHLAAHRVFLETDAETAVIMEDDCVFDPALYWPFDWRWVEARLPFDLDTLQLVSLNELQATMRLHRRFMHDYSIAAYLITRRHAEKLQALLAPNGVACFEQGFRPELTGEVMIYESGSSWSFPLLLIDASVEPLLHAEHQDRIFQRNRVRQMKFWTEDVKKIVDPERLVAEFGRDWRVPPELVERVHGLSKPAKKA
ncbi:MAG: glycosyltransferase family 25 protein [Pseudomonadota bacterium]